MSARVPFGSLALLGLTLPLPAQSDVHGFGAWNFDSRWNRDAFVEVAAGERHTLARRAGGTLAAWGSDGSSETTVPPLPPGLGYTGVAGGVRHSLAIRSDGALIAWGFNSNGQCNAPALPPGTTYVDIAAGIAFTLARRSDGVVVAFGDNSHGQCAVAALPPGLAYVEIAAGGLHALARRSDGSVVGWGSNGSGECDVLSIPAEATFVEIAAGYMHSFVRSEPRIVAFCEGDGSGVACPCTNSGALGRGCENSHGTGGALLAASGVASLSDDTLVFQVTGELPSVLSLVLQGGTSIGGIVYGDGVRCVASPLKRLYAKFSVQGVVIAPSGSDLSVSATSSARGDALSAGATRSDQTAYRDANPNFCPSPPGNTWNVSNGLRAVWGP